MLTDGDIKNVLSSYLDVYGYEIINVINNDSEIIINIIPKDNKYQKS